MEKSAIAGYQASAGSTISSLSRAAANAFEFGAAGLQPLNGLPLHPGCPLYCRLWRELWRRRCLVALAAPPCLAHAIHINSELDGVNRGLCAQVVQPGLQTQATTMEGHGGQLGGC